ncbi:MAG: hypothetical protein ACE5FC_06570 [Myxococcota bacterium]
MIGLWQSKASAFLRVLAVGTLLAFGLPMLLWPLGWAAAFGWDLPADTDLAVYFGRCLASVICILGFLAFRAAARPALQPFYFDIMIGAFALMVGVHVYGGLQGIQPRSETLEVAYWLLMILLALLFYPRAEARSAP